MINKLRIRKLGVWSVMKMYAVIGLVMGLIIGVPYGLIVIAISLMGAGGAGGDAAYAIGGGGIVVGVIMMVVIPIMYCVFAAVGGAIGALLYNLFAAIVGGIEIEVEQAN